jgi:N-acylneuraminate cytidylyltransferase
LAAKNCKLITDFYVSSDDEKILSAAEEIGYKRIVRPKELAQPTSQHIDAIKHALGFMKAEGYEPDIIVVILANNAITKTEWIEESIQNLLDNPELSSSCPVMLEQDHHPYR